MGFLDGLVGLGGLGVALAPVAVSFGAGVTTSDLFADSSVVVVFLVDVVTLGARVVAFGVVTSFLDMHINSSEFLGHNLNIKMFLNLTVITLKEI